jgi:hypothetical protein
MVIIMQRVHEAGTAAGTRMPTFEFEHLIRLNLGDRQDVRAVKIAATVDAR